MALGSTKSEDMSLDACYGSTRSSVWPSAVYLHLYTGDPAAGGRELVHGTGGYAAIEVANTTDNWAAASGGQKSNATTLSFPTSTTAWSGVARYCWLTDSATAVTAPTNPTVTVHGATGSTNWQYVVTAINSQGETQASGIGGTTTGVVTLSGTNYNVISWTAVDTATGYNLYRRKGTTGTFKRVATGISGTSHDDTGTAASTVTPPSGNTTSNLLDGGPLSTPISVTSAGYAVSFQAGAIVIAAT